MENYKELLTFIQQIFDTKFDSLDTKLDMINMNLNANHIRLETRINSCEDELDALKNRPRDESINVKNEVIKTVIHWGIPIIIIAVIYFVQQGKLVG